MDDLDEVLARRRELIIRGATLMGVLSAWMRVRIRKLAYGRLAITYGSMTARDQQR